MPRALTGLLGLQRTVVRGRGSGSIFLRRCQMSAPLVPRAVIFDLGGVIVPSPFTAINGVERRLGLDLNSINRAIAAAGSSGSFARLERGEIFVDQFEEEFAKEYQASSGRHFDVNELMVAFGESMSVPYPFMLDALRCIRAEGLRTALLTNNWRWRSGGSTIPAGVRECFDEVFESAVEKISKPDPRAYQTVLERLGVEGKEAVFLDDIGRNCKAASQLGICAIKVKDPKEALKELEKIVQFPLQGYVPGTKAARGKHSISKEALASYLRNHLSIDADEYTLNIRKYSHGQSNPTFFVGTGTHRMVLRKKPPGKLLQSAHAVEREYKVTSKLYAAGIPVAKPLILCEDSSVLGTPFYLMEHVQGRLLKEPHLPSVEPAERTAIYSSMNATLAKLHSAPYKEIGLHDYGKEGNYILRQVSIWSKQYEASKTHSIPDMDLLMEWLPKHAPTNAETSIVHGDFRLDNCILAEDAPEVKAILDWELSTVGDPLSDLAYNCMPYHMSSHLPPPLSGLMDLDLKELGIPSEEEYISMYCKRRGISGGIPNLNYYLSFSFFRLAAIVQGVHKRALRGQASSDNASQVGALAELYADMAVGFQQKEAQRLRILQSKL